MTIVIILAIAALGFLAFTQWKAEQASEIKVKSVSQEMFEKLIDQGLAFLLLISGFEFVEGVQIVSVLLEGVQYLDANFSEGWQQGSKLFALITGFVKVFWSGTREKVAAAYAKVISLKSAGARNMGGTLTKLQSLADAA